MPFLSLFVTLNSKSTQVVSDLAEGSPQTDGPEEEDRRSRRRRRRRGAGGPVQWTSCRYWLWLASTPSHLPHPPSTPISWLPSAVVRHRQLLLDKVLRHQRRRFTVLTPRYIWDAHNHIDSSAAAFNVGLYALLGIGRYIIFVVFLNNLSSIQPKTQ